MTRFTTVEADELDALLGGSAPTDLDELAPVAEFVSAVRRSASAGRAPVMGASLREQIERHPPVPSRHVRAARRRLLLPAVGGALLALVAAASQNALPAPVQRTVASVSDLVGIDAPRPEDKDDTPSPDDGGGREDRPRGSDEDGSDEDGSDEDGSDDGGSARTDPRADPAPDATTDAGPPEETPGGATPADPGTPGDHEPAIPAMPPEIVDGGQDSDAIPTTSVTPAEPGGTRTPPTPATPTTGTKSETTGTPNASGRAATQEGSAAESSAAAAPLR